MIGIVNKKRFLINTDFALLFFGRLVSDIGHHLYNFAIGWYVLTITSSAAQAGSAGFDFEGTYTRVTPFSRYDYVMSDGREVVVTLKHFFNTVTVSYVFDPESENPREMQQEGWQSILNSLKAFVEKQPK